MTVGALAGAAPAASRPVPRGLLAFFSINYFAQGMAGVVYEPVSFLLKDGLKLDAGQAAAFVSWMTLPFLIKPALGLLTDFLPLGGRLRRPHLALGAGIGFAGWATLACWPGAPGYGPLLALLILVNVAVVFCDVVCDGVMVEASRAAGGSALYQSVQIGTLYATLALTGLGGGWIAKHASPQTAFAAAALLSLLTLASAALAPEEARRTARGGPAALAGLLRSRRFRLVAGIILLWNFAPYLGTAEFYLQTERLRLDPVFIGFLSTLAGGAGLAGAALFPAMERRASLPGIIRAGALVGGPLQFLYLFYSGPVSAALLTAAFGALGVILRLALMDLSARSCPPGTEATAFAVYISIFNLAAWSSNALGGAVYGRLGAEAAWPVLCGIGALTTLLSIPLVNELRGELTS